MLRITSKRHPVTFYLTVFIGALLFLVLGIILLPSDINPYNTALQSPKGTLIIVSSLLFLNAFYLIFRYYKNAPNIIVDTYTISFNKQIFKLEELVGIELTGKQPFPYIINHSMEGAAFYFKNKQVKYMYNDIYSNSSEIKSFIKQIVIDKKGIFQITDSTVKAAEMDKDNFTLFKGKQLTSVSGIALWSLILFVAYIIITEKFNLERTLSLLTLGLIWFAHSSWWMYYFKVSENYFVVKDHNFIWKESIYRITNIKEITFETASRKPNCLRITTKDFRIKLYPASTLSNKKWLELKDNLETKGVKVINKCITDSR